MRSNALGREHQDKSTGSGLSQITGELLLALGRDDDAIACFDAELAKTDSDARILAFLGRSRAHLAKQNIPAAVADANAAIMVWSSYEYCDYGTPGYPSLIAIDDKRFDYYHQSDERVVKAFESQQDRRCVTVALCLRYLIDRQSKEVGLARLQELQKSFDLAAIDYDLSRRYAEAGKPAMGSTPLFSVYLRRIRYPRLMSCSRIRLLGEPGGAPGGPGSRPRRNRPVRRAQARRCEVYQGGGSSALQ